MSRIRVNIIVISIFSLYFSHFLILGQDTYVLIHDNLDFALTQYKALADYNLYFKANDYFLTHIGENIPRAVLPSDLSIINIFFYFLSAFWAYFILVLMNHSIAFIGMYKILSLDKNEQDDYLKVMVALCFSLLPFWPFGALSVAGLPLLLNSILSLKNKISLQHSLVVVFFPFFSSLFLIGVFLIITLALYGIYLLSKKHFKNFNRIMLVTSLLGVFYVIVEWRVVFNILQPIYISHRFSMVPNGDSVVESINILIKNFLFGHYHAASLQSAVIIPAVILVLIKQRLRVNRQIKILLGLAFLISMIYAVWGSNLALFLKDKILFLKSFNFSRFHFYHPLIWSLIFYFSLKELKDIKRIRNILIYIQLIFLFFMSDFSRNVFKQRVSFNDFFNEINYEKVKKTVKDHGVISLGVHPAVLQFHKVKTFDFYLTNYPIIYKEKLAKFSASLLKEDHKLKKYLKNWGNRAYLFSKQTGKGKFYKIDQCDIENIKLNFNELKPKYLFTKCEISKVNGLKLKSIDLKGKYKLYDLRDSF